MSYTPGPWLVETVLTQVGICHKVGNDKWPGSCGKPVTYACVYVDGASAYKPQLGKEFELLSNAKLMAASPEMYEALSKLVGAVKVIQDSEYDRASDWDRLERVVGECERVMGKAVSS